MNTKAITVHALANNIAKQDRGKLIKPNITGLVLISNQETYHEWQYYFDKHIENYTKLDLNSTSDIYHINSITDIWLLYYEPNKRYKFGNIVLFDVWLVGSDTILTAEHEYTISKSLKKCRVYFPNNGRMIKI